MREDQARRGFLTKLSAPLLMLIGTASLATAASTGARLGGALMLGVGAFTLARPYLAARLAERASRGRRRVCVRLRQDGIQITRSGRTLSLAWSEVTAAGARGDYVWYEVRGRQRATLPARVLEDRGAVEALFRAHTKWESA